MPLKNGFDFACHFYLQHGWGFNRDCFQEWPNHIKRGCVTVLDRGYFGPPLSFIKEQADEFTVLVSHSLGVHFLSPDQLNTIDMFVVLSGFASFHGFHPEDGIISRKHIKRMQGRLTKDPKALLKDFYRDCSWSGELPDFAHINRDLLTEDLLLLDTVILQNEHLIDKEILILHGSNDRIVSLERARELHGQLSGSSLHLIDGAGHGMPFTHPEQCLFHIKNHLTRYLESK